MKFLNYKDRMVVVKAAGAKKHPTEQSTSEILSGFGRVAEGVIDQTGHHITLYADDNFLSKTSGEIHSGLVRSDQVCNSFSSVQYKINNSKTYTTDRGYKSCRITS